MSASDEGLGLYRCGCPLDRPAADATPPAWRDGIDLHCHVVVPEVAAVLAGRPELAAEQAQLAAQMGPASMAHNQAMLAELVPKLIDPAERLADMDRLGIAVQVLSPSPTQYCYWADPAIAEQIVALQNDRLAAICRQYPDRFQAFGAVAMQHPELATRQLGDLMRRGFKGAEISTRIGERDLSDAAFEPFWRLAAESGAVIFIHPMGSTLGDRIEPFYLSNVIGQPLETTIALSRLIFAGVFDRHPALRLLAAHGGGYLPAYFGRADHAHAVRPEAGTCDQRPSAYLKRIWYDTVVHDPAILAALVQIAGVSQIVLGTDYPFDMGEYRLGALLDAVPGLGEADRRAIVRRNACNLLGMADARASAPDPSVANNRI